MHIYRKKRIIDVLKVIVDVQAMAGGDKKELRKSCKAFLDEAMPELSGLQDDSDKRMSKIIQEESEKTYMVQASATVGARPTHSGRKKWRRR